MDQTACETGTWADFGLALVEFAREDTGTFLLAVLPVLIVVLLILVALAVVLLLLYPGLSRFFRADYNVRRQKARLPPSQRENSGDD